MTETAKNLLIKLSPKNYPGQKKLRKSTKDTLIDFQKYLNEIKRKHIKRDYSGNHQYLIGCIFKNNSKIEAGEVNGFVKAQLYVAIDSFNCLVGKIEYREGKLNHSSISKYRDHIKEYLFDIKPFVEFVERRTDPNFSLLEGGKTYANSAFELFRTCEALYWYPNKKNGSINRKAAINLNVFLLRQSMEIKFKRMLGVFDVTNKYGNSLKIKHDFWPNFIANNGKLINVDLPEINMKYILKIYKWTNETIHQAINPRIWEVYYALEIVKSFFKVGIYTNVNGSQILSIYAAVKLRDHEKITDKLMDAIYKETGENIFCYDNSQPEAIIDSK